MKIRLCLILTGFLAIFTFTSNTFAQDYIGLGLPEGAKARFGKGWISGDIAYSPNGRQFAVASSVGIWIYDANTFSEVSLLTGHTGAVSSIAFSPNGRRLVSGGHDSTVRVWHVYTGQLLHTLEEHTDKVLSVAFSPDGKIFASSDVNDTIQLWDAHTFQTLHTLSTKESFFFLNQPGWVYSVAFSPDGKTLANGDNNNSIRIWDVSTGKLLHKMGGHDWGIRSVAFSSDGVTLASGDGDGYVRLWGARVGKHWQTLGRHRWGVNAVLFSPDGKIVASAGKDNQIKLWDAFTGEHLRTLDGHTSPVLSMSFRANGRTLASVSWTEIKIWDTNTGKLLRTVEGHTQPVNSISISSDTKTLVSGHQDGMIQFWNLHSRKYLHTLKGHESAVYSVSFSPNGKTLASGGKDTGNRDTKKIHLWDVGTKQRKDVLTGHTSDIYSVSFSPDGKTLASASRDREMRLWDVKTGKSKLKFEYPTGARDDFYFYNVSFSPDGQMLVSAGIKDNVRGIAESGSISIWHIGTGRRLRTLVRRDDFQTYSTMFSPDGSIIAGGVGDEIWLLNPRSGERLQTLVGHNDDHNIFSVVFSPDGQRLASGSSDNTIFSWSRTTGLRRQPTAAGRKSDNTIFVWDVTTGAEEQKLVGHKESITSVLFSSDGKTLISGSLDGTVLLWDLTTSATHGNSAASKVKESTIQPVDIAEAVDVNGDGNVNVQDLSIVVNALGKKAEDALNADVNKDGNVNVDDLLLVIEYLDDPVDAAAPSLGTITITLAPAQLREHLNILRVQNDGSLKFNRAIAFLKNLIAAVQPDQTALLTNYPNPFNPETWIPYQLAEPADVKLTIHAVDGTIVRTLVLRHQPIGIYQEKSRAAYWDGRNTQGEPVASGVYFYTLTAGDFTATRKMLLRK